MNLLDELKFDTLTDTDLSEMLDQNIECEVRRRLIAGGSRPLSSCTETATHWVRLTCRRCGKGVRLITCFPCARFFTRGMRIIGSIIIPWMKHENCRRPGMFRVTNGAL